MFFFAYLKCGFISVNQNTTSWQCHHSSDTEQCRHFIVLLFFFNFKMIFEKARCCKLRIGTSFCG